MSGVFALMTSTGAILEGHFELTSGRHSDVYLEKFRLLERPEVVERIGEMMAEAFFNHDANVVIGAAVGGILLSHATAKVLGAKAIFAERVDGKLTLRRGFRLTEDDRVLVVEDIVTTGGSVRELLKVVAESGANAVGAVSLADRSEDGVDFGIPTVTLLRYPATSWKPESCPLCKKGILLESRGRTGKK